MLHFEFTQENPLCLSKSSVWFECTSAGPLFSSLQSKGAERCKPLETLLLVILFHIPRL